MKVKIYQINNERDRKSVAFKSLASLSRYQGSPEVDVSLYDLVWEGDVNAEDLEVLFRIFNIEKPEDYLARSLSVSDVVEVIDSQQPKEGFYYCDVIGFRKIPFDSHKK